MIEALLFALLAGGAIPLGGFLVSLEKLSPGWLEEDFHHAVISFGGGVLLSVRLWGSHSDWSGIC